MKKIITLAFVAAAAITATNASAISEGYRKQLQREDQTQMQESHAAHSNFKGVRKYKGGNYLIEADKNCKIKTINGFPPKGSKRFDASMTVYTAAIPTKFTAFTTAEGCKYQYSYNGDVGDLVAQ